MKTHLINWSTQSLFLKHAQLNCNHSSIVHQLNCNHSSMSVCAPVSVPISDVHLHCSHSIACKQTNNNCNEHEQMKSNRFNCTTEKSQFMFYARIDLRTRTTRSHCACMQFLKLKSIVAWNWTRLANETLSLQIEIQQLSFDLLVYRFLYEFTVFFVAEQKRNQKSYSVLCMHSTLPGCIPHVCPLPGWDWRKRHLLRIAMFLFPKGLLFYLSDVPCLLTWKFL